MRNMISLILGGGKGTRLYPLTQYRSKPAVPLAAKYRLIDIPISNCLTSGLNRIYLLTQFNSVSLHRHIRQTYSFDQFDGGFVEILAAQQTVEGTDWYQGTADAVRKNLRYLQQRDIDYVLILSGDQLYHMDFEKMLRSHREAGADVTIAGVPKSRSEASGFGIMRLNNQGRVVGFLEKPTTDEEFDLVRTDPAWIDAQGIASQGRDCLASMGIYLFNRDILVDLLSKSDYHDFGKEVFPMSIRTHKVHVHLFDGYWEDIGTIGSFYEANLALTHANPPFDLGSPDAPIYTRARFLPPTRVEEATIRRPPIRDGSIIESGAIIEDSIVGLRCRVGKNAVIRNSILMGADYYDDKAKASEEPRLGVGEGTVIEGAIVDKNCSIGRNVRILRSDAPKSDMDVDSVGTQPGMGQIVVRDGIVVVPKHTILPDGWSMNS